MTKAVDLNTAKANQMTQLPGIAKDLAYRIVNHRNRHGYFTIWEELTEVKGFPAGRLEEIKARAVLSHPGGPYGFASPRHMKAHVARERKKTEGFTRAIRTTRRPDKLKQSTGIRH